MVYVSSSGRFVTLPSDTCIVLDAFVCSDVCYHSNITYLNFQLCRAITLESSVGHSPPRRPPSDMFPGHFPAGQLLPFPPRTFSPAVKANISKPALTHTPHPTNPQRGRNRYGQIFFEN